jgi:hypothetical protein
MKAVMGGSRDFDGAHDGALHQFDLEVIVPVPLRAFCRERCRGPERRPVEAGSGQGCLNLRDSPRLGSDPAKGDVRLPDAAGLHVERHRG